VIADGTAPAWPDACFDRVLIDAPCTGLGALRRRPEARWRREPGDVGRLFNLQRELLVYALAAARPGGVVGYVTCSPHVGETKGVVLAARAAAEKAGVHTESLDAAAQLPTSRKQLTVRTFSCGRTGTAPTRCSSPCCAAGPDSPRQGFGQGLLVAVVEAGGEVRPGAGPSRAWPINQAEPAAINTPDSAARSRQPAATSRLISA